MRVKKEKLLIIGGVILVIFVYFGLLAAMGISPKGVWAEIVAKNEPVEVTVTFTDGKEETFIEARRVTRYPDKIVIEKYRIKDGCFNTNTTNYCNIKRINYQLRK